MTRNEPKRTPESEAHLCVSLLNPSGVLVLEGGRDGNAEAFQAGGC